MKDEYILNETSLEIDQKSASWGELADMQADAESRWNETDEGRELALLERGADETTIELYKALKACLKELEYLDSQAVSIVDNISREYVSPDPEAIYNAQQALRKAEGEN